MRKDTFKKHWLKVAPIVSGIAQGLAKNSFYYEAKEYIREGQLGILTMRIYRKTKKGDKKVKQKNRYSISYLIDRARRRMIDLKRSEITLKRMGFQPPHNTDYPPHLGNFH